MTCYKPIPAFRDTLGGPVTLHPQIGLQNMALPCGKCIGCRTDRASDWTRRCIHEAQLHDNNTFITLTYDDRHLPKELRPDHLQKFLKRLRKAATTRTEINTNRNANIRYLACGQYGGKTQRPHYHLCGFNLDFNDKVLYKQTETGPLYTSDTLDRIWQHGAAKIAAFEAGTAGYVAGYLTKDGRREYANEDGELLQRPFLRASTRPALGRKWLEKYETDIQHGYMIIDGRKTRIPRYYIKRLEINNGQLKEVIDWKIHNAPKGDARQPARLTAAELIHLQHVNRKQRDQNGYEQQHTTDRDIPDQGHDRRNGHRPDHDNAPSSSSNTRLHRRTEGHKHIIKQASGRL